MDWRTCAGWSVAEVWGDTRVRETAGGFTPHVSLAYSDTDGWDGPYAAGLFGIAPCSITVEFGAIQLIALCRDKHLYRWDKVATVPLGLDIEI